MAITSSGTICLSNVQAEFGGSNPICLSEYYGAASGVPSSGTICLSNFYGKSAAQTINVTISSSTTNYNMRTAFVDAGWDGSKVLNGTVTVNSGVTVYSTSTGSYALQTGSPYPSGSSIALVNNGTILGKGGNAGAGGAGTTGYNGSGGGPAFYAASATTVTNNGRIAGGGGGAGGGGAGY